MDSIEATAKEKIYIYDAPSSSAERIGYLNAGNSVTVLKKNDSWAYVTKSGNYGYTPLSGLQNGNGLDSVAPPPPPPRRAFMFTTRLAPARRKLAICAKGKA